MRKLQILTVIKNFSQLLKTPGYPGWIGNDIVPVIDPTTKGWMNAKTMIRSFDLLMTTGGVKVVIVSAEQSAASLFTICYPTLITDGAAGDVYFNLSYQGTSYRIGKMNLGNEIFMFDVNAANARATPMHGFWVPEGFQLDMEVAVVEAAATATFTHTCIITPHGQGIPDVGPINNM